MDYQTRELPTREALLRAQELDNFTPDVSGVDLPRWPCSDVPTRK